MGKGIYDDVICNLIKIALR